MGPISIFSSGSSRHSAANSVSSQDGLSEHSSPDARSVGADQGFFRKLIGGGNTVSEPMDAAAAAAVKHSMADAKRPFVPKEVMDVLGPLLPTKSRALATNTPGTYSTHQDATMLLDRSMSASSGLTEYVNKMQISEPHCAKQPHYPAAIAAAPPPAAAAAAQAYPNPASIASKPQPSSLDRLLEQARHCNLPVSPRGPETATPVPAPAGAGPSTSGSSNGSSNTSSTHPSVMLSMSSSVPPKMHRASWSLDDYIIHEKLYTGYASMVYKATCRRSGDIVVLKIYTLSAVCDLYKYQIYREIRVHSQLQHENIVHLFASFQQGEKVVLVQEYADGSDLFNLLHKYGGRLSERLAVQMVLEPFLRVLQYLHTRGIIHRDIKPENIMFTKNMCLKLGDFGLAIDLREERAVTRAGTLDYMAPEVLRCPFKSRPNENKDNIRLHYSNRVDSWAVGVLTYELVVGFPPFFDQTRSGTEDRIMTSAPAFPATVSEEAKNFVCASLSKAPAERPTILELLNHSWVDSYRTRRSMRNMAQLGDTAAMVSALPSSAAVAAAASQATMLLPPRQLQQLQYTSQPHSSTTHVVTSSLRSGVALPAGLTSVLSSMSSSGDDSTGGGVGRECGRDNMSGPACSSLKASCFDERVSPNSTLLLQQSKSLSNSSDGSAYMHTSCDMVDAFGPSNRLASSFLC